MSSKKLLVADDSPTIQKVIRLALSGEGYEIQSVTNSSEALEKIPLFNPDIILIDVSLPDKNAFDVKSEVDAQTGLQPQYILMSRAFEKIDESRVLTAGFQHRLVIPFDPAQLRELLQQLIQRSQGSASPLAAEVVKKTALPMDSDLLEPSSLIKNPRLQPPPFSRPQNSPIAPESEPLSTLISSANDEKSEVTIEVVNLDIEHQFHPSHQTGNQEEITVAQDFSVEEEIISSSPYQSPTMNLEPTPIALETYDPDEDDIQKLTRKTMEMSSFSETRLGGEWSIDENGAKSILSHTQKSIGDDTLTSFKKQEPELTPYNHQMDLADSTFPLNPVHPNLHHDHPTLTEDENGVEKTMDLMSPTKLLDISQMRAKELHLNNLKAATDPHISVEPQVVPLSHEQMQRILSDQMRSTLEEMAREILPDIAERIIKQEIHKMLADHPSN